MLLLEFGFHLTRSFTDWEGTCYDGKNQVVTRFIYILYHLVITSLY
jgi:hypothetical protein